MKAILNHTFKICLVLTTLFTSCSDDESDVQPVTITIENVNRTISENPLNNQILARDYAASSDQSALTYSLTNQSITNALYVDPTNGAIMVNIPSVFDFETNPIITATVNASTGAVTASAAVTITLTDKVEAPTNGLVAAYTFNSGNANDDTENNYHASTITATLTSDRFNTANRAYAFNGSQYIQINEFAAFDLPTMSISLWFKSNSSTSTQRLVFLGNDAQNRQNFSLNYNVTSDGKVDFRYEPDIPLAGGFAVSNAVLNDNVWHHLVGVRNTTNNTLRIYVDGVFQNSIDYTNIPVAADYPLQIGRSFADYSQYFTGSIDDVRIYNRALPTADISLLFNEESSN